jgi:hypothetical protein
MIGPTVHPPLRLRYFLFFCDRFYWFPETGVPPLKFRRAHSRLRTTVEQQRTQ